MLVVIFENITSAVATLTYSKETIFKYLFAFLLIFFLAVSLGPSFCFNYFANPSSDTHYRHFIVSESALLIDQQYYCGVGLSNRCKSRQVVARFWYFKLQLN